MGLRKVIYVIVIFLLVISIVYFPVAVGEEDKHRVITEEEFQNKLENEDYDFSWCVFPFEVDLSERTLTDADFSNAVFEEDVYFENITFDTTGDNYTNFEEVTFKEEVEFIGISFEKGVKFDNAIFEGDKNNFCDINATEYVHFNNVTFKKSTGIHRFLFKQGIDFSGSIFGHYTIFGGSNYPHIIKKSAIFENVTFNGNVTFMNVDFEGNARFNSVEPTEKSLSKSTVFKGYTYFEHVDFNGTADFNDVRFEDEVLFLIVTFKKDVSFKKGSQKKGTIFEGETSFSGVNFEESVYFDDAVFKDIVWFQSHGANENTTFGKESYPNDRQCQPIASFKGTEFRDIVGFDCIFYIEADFQSVKFNGNTYFVGTVFNESVDFKDAEFGRVSNFSNANFRGETNFNRAVFRDNVYFKNTDFGESRDTEINLGATFERMLIFRPKSLYKINMSDFQALEYTEIKADLTDAEFKDVYLSNVNFIDCKWPEDYKVYEETHMNDDLSYRDLEKIYRNIKVSFQNYGDNEMAGYFLYREKEMKREGTLFFKNPFHWALIHLYWGTCGYGERFSFILFWSFGTMVGFALLFWILGIEVNNLPWRFEFFNFREDIREVENRQVVRNYIREFDLDRNKILNYIWRKLSEFGLTQAAYCLLFSITSFSTLGTKYIKPKGNASRWLSAVESLIGAFFIALFIYVFARKMLR